MKAVFLTIVFTIGGVLTPGGTTDETYDWAPREQPSMEVCLIRKEQMYRDYLGRVPYVVTCEERDVIK